MVIEFLCTSTKRESRSYVMFWISLKVNLKYLNMSI